MTQNHQYKEKDYLLIGIDGQTRFIWRFLCLSHTLGKVLAVHQPPEKLLTPFSQFVLGSTLLGSRYDEQETTLYKVRIEETEIRFNCEISPSGPLRAALFPSNILGDFNGFFKGELSEHILKKNNQVYQSMVAIEPDNMEQTWRSFLKQSRQSSSLLEFHSHFALWIEKLPETPMDEWEKFLKQFNKPQGGAEGEASIRLGRLEGATRAPLIGEWEKFTQNFGHKRLEEALKMGEDPDLMMGQLFQKDFRILKVQIPYFECQCSKDRILLGLAGLPPADLFELFVDGKGVESRCDYCHKIHKVSDEEVKNVIKSGGIH